MTTDTGTASLVRYERRGSLALLTLDRPAKLNAVNKAMIRELHRALDAAEADAAVRAIVLAGEGRAFSAGFDLDMEVDDGGPPNPAAVREAVQSDFDIILRFWDSPKVTVAAVQGYCLGSAMELALACDLTVAAADCYFGEPEVRFGSGIVALLLPWLTGPKQAKELLLTGEDRVTAARAHELGLVNRVVPRESLLEDTLALARQITGNDPVAVKLTKQAINRSLDAAGFRTALRQALDLDVQIETAESAESREFNAILKRDGAKAAIAWRNSRANAEATEGGP